MSIASRFLVLACFGIAAGCAAPTEAPLECGPCVTTAIVTVAVLDSALVPVQRVPIRVLSYLDVCGGTLRGGGGSSTSNSGTSGVRRFQVTSPFSEHVAQCLEVIINEGGESGFPVGTRKFEVPLAFRATDDQPRDSVRLEVIIPPATDL